MALYLHSPIRMTLNVAHEQRLLGTSQLLFPSKFKLLCMHVFMYVCMHACIYYVCNVFFPPMALQPQVGQALLIVEASRLHSDTPHSVDPLRTSDQSDTETST